MNSKSNNFLIGDNLPWENPAEGIVRQVMGYDSQLMLVKVVFKKGAIGYVHEHFHAQSSYVVCGSFEVTINGISKILKEGDGFYVEPNVPHGAVCLEDGILIDGFNPMRQDFID